MCGNGLTTVQSRLGYLLSGPLPLPKPVEAASLHVSILSRTTTIVTHGIFWNVESTGTTRSIKTSDTDFFFTEVHGH